MSRWLVDALQRSHDLAIAPYWPRIHEHLEGDTIRRGQALALGGVETLLSKLHPKARYGGGVLELDKLHEALIEPAGRGITLVPSVFTWPRVMVLTEPGYQPTLAYGPRGVAEPVDPLLAPCSQRNRAGGSPGSRAGVRALEPLPHADHHHRVRQPTPP